MKICNKCKRTLDENCFSKRSDTVDGLSYICKDCKKNYDKEFDKRKREELNKTKTCIKCGKTFEHEQIIDGVWYVSKFCKECYPEQQFKICTCEKCGKVFKVGRKPSKLNDFIIRKYCPECSSMNQDTKTLICPKCGKEYKVKRTPDGRHYEHKRVCDDCSKKSETKTLTCEKCGKDFIVHKYPGTDSFQKVKFCSPFCASTQTEFRDGKVQLKKVYTNCKHCGKQFELKYDKNLKVILRTVCDDCLKPKKKPKYINKICSICGKQFKAELVPCGNYSSTQYCSDECALVGFKTKCANTCREKYGVDFPCLTKKALASNNGKIKSVTNSRFAKLLDKNNIKYQQEFVINPYSYDFIIEDTNYLVEINPTYTHSIEDNHFGEGKTKEYHYNKTKYALEHGYLCICVWDWIDWNYIIKIIKEKKIYLNYVGVRLHYSKYRENIIMPDNPKLLLDKGYEQIYDDGYQVTKSCVV